MCEGVKVEPNNIKVKQLPNINELSINESKAKLFNCICDKYIFIFIFIFILFFKCIFKSSRVYIIIKIIIKIEIIMA
jgi:hypothetical protein